MAEACGVSWDGTSGGKLDRSSIPDPPDHKSHFLNAGETKGESSFPVVDGEGNLRAGNVNSAWDLRNQGDGVSEECLRKLDNAFDEDVLPDSAYENSSETVPLSEVDVDGDNFGVNIDFSQNRLPQDVLGDGFNEYGVRKNEDGSVDVRFKVMEVGTRKGVDITPEFLDTVASYEYGRIPLQLDHSDSQRANVGFARPDNVKFNDGSLQAQVHIPNTGNRLRDDVIADFTHDPPQITDISVGFNPRTLEVERGRGKDNPEFVDGRIREFSLTPFPAGYDNGGLTPEFSAAVEKATFCGCDDSTDEARSYLVTKPHIITTKHD